MSKISNIGHNGEKNTDLNEFARNSNFNTSSFQKIGVSRAGGGELVKRLQ